MHYLELTINACGNCCHVVSY